MTPTMVSAGCHLVSTGLYIVEKDIELLADLKHDHIMISKCYMMLVEYPLCHRLMVHDMVREKLRLDGFDFAMRKRP